MERLLAILFSVMLLIATAPPRVPVGGCSYSGGMCVQNESCTTGDGTSCSPGHKDKSEKKSACPMPICCVYGPCCCLCLVPERPVLPAAFWPDEVRIKPATHRLFLPQQVWLAVWKPPAFSV